MNQMNQVTEWLEDEDLSALTRCRGHLQAAGISAEIRTDATGTRHAVFAIEPEAPQKEYTHAVCPPGPLDATPAVLRVMRRGNVENQPAAGDV